MGKFTLMNLEGRHITRTMLSNMTEKTQKDMFGKVLQKRFDHSIHRLKKAASLRKG